jgi:hypothetical protein
VIARTSSFAFKDSPTSAADIGRRLNVANLLEGSKSPYEYYKLPSAHARARETDAAFAALERAFQTHDPDMDEIMIDPLLTNLRADARYGTLLARMGLRPPTAARAIEGVDQSHRINRFDRQHAFASLRCRQSRKHGDPCATKLESRP